MGNGQQQHCSLLKYKRKQQSSDSYQDSLQGKGKQEHHCPIDGNRTINPCEKVGQWHKLMQLSNVHSSPLLPLYQVNTEPEKTLHKSLQKIKTELMSVNG